MDCTTETREAVKESPRLRGVCFGGERRGGNVETALLISVNVSGLLITAGLVPIGKCAPEEVGGGVMPGPARDTEVARTKRGRIEFDKDREVYLVWFDRNDGTEICVLETPLRCVADMWLSDLPARR